MTRTNEQQINRICTNMAPGMANGGELISPQEKENIING